MLKLKKGISAKKKKGSSNDHLILYIASRIVEAVPSVKKKATDQGRP